MQLSGINRYPVKSCRGEALTTSEVEPWGLAGDRRWMVVDVEGAVITAREASSLLLVEPSITATGLSLTAPGLPTLAVPTPDPARRVPVTIWGSSLEAAATEPEAEEWLSAALGRAARLVHLDDPTTRRIDPDFSDPDDRVSFADAYPLLLVTEDSLAALDDAILERHAEDPEAPRPLPMARLRPNVVVAGAAAWEEDDWRRVRIGEAVFRAVKGCARCVMTTLDPETAARGKEPLTTLAGIRRWDGQTWFGTNLVPDNPGATISVGDQVEVLDAVEPGAGPIRPRA